MEFSQKIIITGLILPHNWDDDGRIIEIAIYTNTEEIIAVEHSTLTRELLPLLQKSVEIRGKTREHPDGKKLLAAQNFTVLEKTADDESKTG